MKKILLLGSIIASCAINANAFYVGVEQSLSNSVTNEINSIKTDNNSNVTSIKIGTRMGVGDAKSSRLEAYYTMGAETSNAIVGDESIAEFGFNYNATFESISPIEKVLPYIKLGGSYVISDKKFPNTVDGELSNYVAAGITIGVGTYYNITDNIDVSIGYDKGYRKWSDLSNGYTTVSSEDNFSKFYIGTNYSF